MKKLCFFRGQRPFKHATIGTVLPAVSHWRDILFGIRRFFMLENVFHLKENHTDVKTEIMAGITTFMTMAYILAVNPNILSASGMDSEIGRASCRERV